jgi:diphthine-ammonia ligase
LSAAGNPPVKLAALYSGGKDSTFAIYRAREVGHQVVCLVTMHPVADDSPLFHYPNSWVTEYLAEAMQIPLIGFSVNGRTKEDEVKALEEAIAQAKSLHGIEGVVYGGISSSYQKRAFEEICTQLNVAAFAPLWNAEPQKYMNELVERGFSIIIVGVSAMGLGKEWLGMQIDKDALGRLAALAKKYGFSLTFEGGEAETLVTDCPLFRKKLQINAATTHWDGQRGIFEIRDVSLVEK